MINDDGKLKDIHGRMRGLVAPLLLGILILNPCGKIWAAKNPLNMILASDFDAKSGEFKTEVCTEGGNNLCSIHDGDYVVYNSYDFLQRSRRLKKHTLIRHEIPTEPR